MEQLLATNIGKIHTHTKFLGSKFGPDGSKLDPKLGFLPFSQVSLVFLEIV